MKIAPKKNKLPLIILSTTIMLVAIGGLVWWFIINPNHTQSSEKKINYNPPTNIEASAGDAQKEKNKEREALENNPPTVTQANVYIVSAEQFEKTIEIRGYIDNIYEDGGKCTAVLTKGDLRVERTSTAFRDAKTVQCGALDVPIEEFKEAGVWRLDLQYASLKYKGSANATVEVK